MDILTSFLQIVLHLDTHLLALTQEYGGWIYGILFLIIFSETGLVVAPFLPGDSLLFVAGALCGLGALELKMLVPILMLAAFLGDNTNYWVGRILGLKLVALAGPRWLKPEHLSKTHISTKHMAAKPLSLLASCRLCGLLHRLWRALD